MRNKILHRKIFRMNPLSSGWQLRLSLGGAREELLVEQLGEQVEEALFALAAVSVVAA